jgi:SAM-dependent methyltransferase
VGRWSRQVAAVFVAGLGVGPGRRWLDVGCGTGSLAAAIVAGSAPARVVGVDPAVGFLTAARARTPGCFFGVGDARALPIRDRAADAVVSGLALNFVPEPNRAVAEFARVTAPGGVAAAFVWDYAEGMRMMRTFWDAATALDPEAAARDEGRLFPVCDPDRLRALWTDAGFAAVATGAIEVPTVFAGFDDYWRPFLGGQGPAPGYVASLDDDHRTELRELLRTMLPAGEIPLTARTWTVHGTRLG